MTQILPKDDGYFFEIKHFIDLISGESVPSLISPEDSGNSVKIIEAEKEDDQILFYNESDMTEAGPDDPINEYNLTLHIYKNQTIHFKIFECLPFIGSRKLRFS